MRGVLLWEPLELTPPRCFVTSLINTALGTAVKLKFENVRDPADMGMC
jgi:hypothetical protein